MSGIGKANSGELNPPASGFQMYTVYYAHYKTLWWQVRLLWHLELQILLLRLLQHRFVLQPEVHLQNCLWFPREI